MNNRNDCLRDYLGITAWHRAGYTGRRGKSASGENFNDLSNSHGVFTQLVFHEVAPDREIVYANITMSERFRELSSEIDTFFASFSLNFGPEQIKAVEGCSEYLSIFASAGNEGSEGYNGMTRLSNVYGVAAVEVVWSQTMNGVPVPGAAAAIKPAHYSSESAHVDFGGLTDWYPGESPSRFSGTSCACPVLAGMAALVNDLAIEQTGRPLTSKGMYQFFLANSVDMLAEGKDEKTGYGLVILPDPATVDIWRYQEMEKEIYKDEKDIAPYHYDDVYRAQALGLMQGGDGHFRPLDPVSRQELASVAVRLYDRVKGEG